MCQACSECSTDSLPEIPPVSVHPQAVLITIALYDHIILIIASLYAHQLLITVALYDHKFLSTHHSTRINSSSPHHYTLNHSLSCAPVRIGIVQRVSPLPSIVMQPTEFLRPQRHHSHSHTNKRHLGLCMHHLKQVLILGTTSIKERSNRVVFSLNKATAL